MKAKLCWVALVVLIVAAGWFLWLRRSGEAPAGKTAATVPARSNLQTVASGGAAAQGRTVVIQTGQERMSNAVRCMLYVVDLANKLPKERGPTKSMVMTLAGVMFFEDCLMSKMSPNGYITVTTNELRQCFANAVAQLGTNVPADLVEGFNGAFSDRNNMRVSLDENYRRMAQYPELARTLDTLDAAFKRAGITDASQSDLKVMCLDLCEIRTTAHLIYGPSSMAEMESQMLVPGAPAEQNAAASRSMREVGAAAYQAMAESLDKVLKWRLTNMYGLDDSAAQSTVQEVSKVPVTGFSHAALEPPAYIQ